MYVKQIKRRRNVDYKMLLAITQNPHTQKPEQLWKTLNDEDSPYYKEEELDKAGFEILKSRIADNPRIKVK